jgi:hypothetical protein
VDITAKNIQSCLVSVFSGGLWHVLSAKASRYPQARDETGRLSTGDGRVWKALTWIGTLGV